jgi:SAM-dependent methyltransferase
MDALLEATRRVEQSHFWWRGLRGFATPLIEAALGGRDNARILDCGCGTGANLAVLARYGRAFGFDLSPDGVEYARSYGQRRIARASITHIPFADAAFDLVTVFDVLYSLSEDQESAAVAEAFRVLRPGGTAIINVAALAILRGQHSVFGGEVRRSTRRRLRALLARRGFEVQRLTYTNASLFPVMLLVRTAQRMIGLATPEEAGTDVVIPPAPFNALLSALLWCEGRALRKVDMPIGSSLLCVARKPLQPAAEPVSRGGARQADPLEEAQRQQVGHRADDDRAERRSDDERAEKWGNDLGGTLPELGGVHAQPEELVETVPQSGGQR